MSRSNIADVDECIDAGEPGRERWGMPPVAPSKEPEPWAKLACVGDDDE